MIYLDNAATSFPKPEAVYRALDDYARTKLANPGRAGHRMAREAERDLDDARLALNRFFNGEGPRQWAFTLNCTDALNIAIKGALRPGDHAVTTDLEHNSISRPLRALEKAGIITFTRVRSERGYVDPAAVRAALTPRTRLVAMTHAANVLGTVQPVDEIARSVREAGALFLLDAAQSAGVVPIDLKATPIDLLAFPGHKALFGPTGTGALYVRPGLSVQPWREGGTGGDSAAEVQPAEMPFALEAGTPNALGIAGLAAGVNWVAQRGAETNRRHEVGLLQRVVDWVEGQGRAVGWKVAGRWEPETHVGALSLITPDLGPDSPQVLAAALDSSFGIATRPGLHCAPFVHRNLGTFPDGTLRVSPGPFTTADEIETLLSALERVVAGLV